MRALWRWLIAEASRRNQWDFLFEYNKNKFRYLSYFLPVLGFYLIKEDSVRRFLLTHPPLADIFGVTNLSVSWKFKMIYLGASSLTVASAILYVFCPPILRLFGSVREWYLKEAHMMTERRLDDLKRQICFLEIGSRHNVAIDEFNSIWSQLSSWRRFGNPSLEQSIHIDENNVNFVSDLKSRLINIEEMTRDTSYGHRVAEIMSMFLVPQKQYLPWARRAAAIFYTLGILLITVPAVWSFMQVVSAIL